VRSRQGDLAAKMYKMKSLLSVLLLLDVSVVSMLLAEAYPVKLSSFKQEIAIQYTSEDGLPSNNVLHVEAAPDGPVYAVTDQGTACFQQGAWKLVGKATGAAKATWWPTSNVASSLSRIDMPAQKINDARQVDSDLLIATDEALWCAQAGERKQMLAKASRQIALGPKGEVVVATVEGLWRRPVEGVFERIDVVDEQSRYWGRSDIRGVAYDSQGRLCFACLAGVGLRELDGKWKFFTAHDGLPYNDFTSLTLGPAGTIWLGSHLGLIGFLEGEWIYRQGKRWLPDDDIRDVTLDQNGSIWVATSKGIGVIERRSMSLAEKAEFYEREMEKYIRRTPLGYVSEVSLAKPADKSKIIYHDSDNDGLWTSMYGAGECFAYGATKNPRAKARAKQAFEALRFLQKVTQGCQHSPPKGYVARTIRSVGLPDPNVGRLARDRRQQELHDAKWKVYEPRWPRSADGKWFWKSDTSSDELDGHYFFYPLYYDLVADTEVEKERVREVVRDLTDHLVEHNYCLVDHDGRPTRWAVFNPEALNHDPDWWEERGLNSLSILSYLTVAEHVTGDSKYSWHVRKLIEEHSYHANLMTAKVQFGFGSGNQSDDEMAVMSFYNLLKYTKDSELRQRALFAFYLYWTVLQPELNPFFNFAYAVHGLDSERKDAWGKYSLNPWSGWLSDSIKTLTGFPLDRLNWAHKNSHRLDIITLPRQQAVPPTQAMRAGRGYRRNGKVLPVQERFFNHWNTDPWRLDYGGNGQQLANGTVFLLPYYMGLYHGFITD
jgi:hypothetical protein